MIHRCHIPDCEVSVSPKMLMCKVHWKKVPDELKGEIRKHFDPDQCKGLVRPSFEWLRVARTAINFVKNLDSKSRYNLT